MFEQIYKSCDKVIQFGDQWCLKMLPIIKNPFWKDVVTDWALLSQKPQIATNSDILHSCLWYNSKIHKGDVFLPSWFNKGIYLIRDILSSDGKIIEKAKIELKYDFKINFWNYFTLRLGLNDLLKQYWCKDSTTCNYTRPAILTHIKPLITSHNSCKLFYNILKNVDSNAEKKSETKWKPILQHDEIFSKDIWNTIYRICFKTIADNNIKWFQYRILLNILCTKQYLYKIKIYPSEMCSFCTQYSESIQHLFSVCVIVSQLWYNVQDWIRNKLGINITISISMKILGYLFHDVNFWPLNFVLLITRKYIFQCSKNGYPLNIFTL